MRMKKDKDILFIDNMAIIEPLAEKFETMEGIAAALVDMMVKYFEKAGIKLETKENRPKLFRAMYLLHKDLIDYVEFMDNGDKCPECLNEDWETETHTENFGEFISHEFVIRRTCKYCNREEVF